MPKVDHVLAYLGRYTHCVAMISYGEPENLREASRPEAGQPSTRRLPTRVKPWQYA